MKTITNITYRSLALFAFACFALSPQARGTCVDACLPGFNVVQGDDGFNLLSTGEANTGLGWRALFSVGAGSFNTAVGAGALVLNTASENTAVGAAALLLNTAGTLNTAIGTDAMFSNDSGLGNNAVGAFALFSNTAGATNEAIGKSAMFSNTTGFANVAIGDGAMSNANGTFNTTVGYQAGNNLTTAGAENIYLGDSAGTLDFSGNFPGDETGVIRIGSAFSGTTACFINSIVNKSIPFANAAVVFIDVTTGQLATLTVDAGGNKISVPAAPATQPQAMLNSKVQELQKQVETLTAQLKEQAAQIQKVSAQLELSKAASQTVLNRY